VRLSQVADALRERAGAPFLSAHIAQVREERHGSVVVARTLRVNERVDSLPGLAFSLGQAGQISITGDLFLAFAPRSSPSLPSPGNLVSRLRHRLGALPQCAGRPITTSPPAAVPSTFFAVTAQHDGLERKREVLLVA
jgi:hypothetical protein